MSDPCKTRSPDSGPKSTGGSCRERGSDSVFRTITADDWKRSLASAKLQRNAVSEQIRTAISSSSRKTR